MIELDYPSLQEIGFHPSLATQSATELATAPPDRRLARVTAVQRDCLTLDDGRQTISARVPSSAHPVVGDWVLAYGDMGQWRLDRILDPVTRLTRRTPSGRQALVNNVDTALLLMGLDQDFNPRRMERYIPLVRACGVAPVMVLTKMDVAGDDGREKAAQLRRRIPADVPALVLHPALQHAGTGGEGGEGALAPWLARGRTLVLLGSSGVGKSTLTNALAGSTQATGGTRRGDDHGRHTTTARSLHRCAGGACIVDTPGLRAWQPDADEDDLEEAFDDIAALAARCRFGDCSHESEPGCAVRGAVDADRLRNWRKLLREVRRAERTALDRIAERGRWKTLVKGVRQRDRQKRGG